MWINFPAITAEGAKAARDEMEHGVAPQDPYPPNSKESYYWRKGYVDTRLPPV